MPPRCQAGRRGIVAVRDLVPLALPLAESPMESEARLVMHDGGLPAPTLQYEIVDRNARIWRVDFAWPDRRVAAEYDGFEWHGDAEALRRDRHKRYQALRELGWIIVPILADDVRRQPRGSGPARVACVELTARGSLSVHRTTQSAGVSRDNARPCTGDPSSPEKNSRQPVGVRCWTATIWV